MDPPLSASHCSQTFRIYQWTDHQNDSSPVVHFILPSLARMQGYLDFLRHLIYPTYPAGKRLTSP